MRYRIGYDATWINKFCACIPDSGPSQTSQERGTRFVGTVKETKGRATRPEVSEVGTASSQGRVNFSSGRSTASPVCRA